MAAQKEEMVSYFRRLRQWITTRLIQDVPEDTAVCEFDCRKLECRQGEWKICERRLRGIKHDKDRGKSA
jgi:hypothetical protein